MDKYNGLIRHIASKHWPTDKETPILITTSEMGGSVPFWEPGEAEKAIGWEYVELREFPIALNGKVHHIYLGYSAENAAIVACLGFIPGTRDSVGMPESETKWVRF